MTNHRVTSPSPGQGFFLAFSPERIDPGNQHWVVENTPKVVGGTTPACREVAVALYGTIIERIVPVSSTQAAEMVKLLENTFRAVNIALVNEIAIMCDKLGIDVWEVIEAAATKPYGFMKFTPGPGVGGHCIPLDPHYLSWKMKTLNYNARFIQLAGEINSDMPRYWVEKVADALNEAGKPVKGSRVLVLGVAYKKDIDDVRESPALDVIELLRHKGADVRYHDPYVPCIRHNGFEMAGEPDLAAALAAADCAVVVTDHSSYDWAAIRRQVRLIVDTRHAIEHRKFDGNIDMDTERFDVARVTAYWITEAEEARGVADHLIDKADYSYELFFGHLAIEIDVEGHLRARFEAHAFPIHNLLKLAKK